SERLVQEGATSRSESVKYWRLFVDAVSLIWLAAFTTSLLAYYTEFITVSPAILYVTDAITLFTLPVFIADLALKYYRRDHSKAFFKKHWVDIISVVPYFRVLRVFSMVKILGLVRLGRIPRAWGVAVNAVRAVLRALRLGKK
ncbi:MAG: hypothetical protein ACE5KU_03820, partial [Nitrososphaerales archaeon]